MKQYERILSVLKDQEWHTLQEISDRTNTPHGSVGSQIRNARVEGYVIAKRRSGPESGTWEYRFTGEKKISKDGGE